MKKMKLSQVFKKAATLLEGKTLNREWYAGARDGNWRSPLDNDVTSLCMVGACARAAKKHIDPVDGERGKRTFARFEISLDKYLRQAVKADKDASMTEWSDKHKKRDVVAALRRAAKLAEKAGD